MPHRLRLFLLIAFSTACGLAVYFGTVEQPVSFSSVLEVWSDVLRDVDQFGLRFTRLSDAEEMRLGADLGAQAPFSTTLDGQPRVAAVGTRLVPFVERRGIRYQFHVVVAAGPNAFALPGGQIYITSAMLQFLQSDDELAAILGHEIAHVDLRHCAERYQRLSKLRPWLFTVEYGKYQELDADAAGLRLSTQAGYDPTAAVALYRRFALAYAPPPVRPARTPVSEAARAASTALGSYFQSHPPSAERAARLEELLRKRRAASAVQH
jgi:beta-barrel assembly-enhancing protease